MATVLVTPERPWSLAVPAMLFLVWAGGYWLQLLLMLLSLGWAVAGRWGPLAPALDRAIRVASEELSRSLGGRDNLQSDWCHAVGLPRDKLEDLLTGAEMPIITLDLDGRICSLNSCATGLLAAERDLQGVFLREILEPRSQAELSSALKKAQSSESGGLTRLAFKDGPVLYLTFTAIKKGDVLSHLVAMGPDARRLEDHQTEETTAWTYALQQHLHGMIGMTDLLLSTVGVKPFKTQIVCLRNATDQMLDQINNVLRLRAPEPPAPAELVDFADLIDEVLALVEAATDKAGQTILKPGVEIRSSIGKGFVPLVIGNRGKLQQLAYNIIHNACRYTLSGAVSVSGLHSKDESTFHFTVKDTGCGIPKELLSATLVPAAEKRPHPPARCMQGPGFGLAAAAEIARDQEAELRLESVEGQGTTVTIILKCANEKPNICPISDEELELDRPFIRSYSMERAGRVRPLVLSVDDDEINQEVIRQSLGDNYDVHCCMDGQSALDWLELNKTSLPDVILLDIQMPGMTGYEVCRRIRQNYNESLWELPITLLSAKAPASSVAVEGFNHGSTDFIAKPFDRDLLRKKVSLSLDMKQSLPSANKSRRDEAAASKIAKTQAAISKSESARKQAAVLLHEHKEQVESLEARVESQAQEIAELQEELLKAREERRSRSTSPSKRKKTRKPVFETQPSQEQSIGEDLAAHRQRSLLVAERLLLQNQFFKSLATLMAEEEVNITSHCGDDFFGFQAIQEQLLDFNPCCAPGDDGFDPIDRLSEMLPSHQLHG